MQRASAESKIPIREFSSALVSIRVSRPASREVFFPPCLPDAGVTRYEVRARAVSRGGPGAWRMSTVDLANGSPAARSAGGVLTRRRLRKPAA